MVVSLCPEIAVILLDKTETSSNPLLQPTPPSVSLSLSPWGRGVFNPSGLCCKLGESGSKRLQNLLQTVGRLHVSPDTPKVGKLTYLLFLEQAGEILGIFPLECLRRTTFHLIQESFELFTTGLRLSSVCPG